MTHHAAQAFAPRRVPTRMRLALAITLALVVALPATTSAADVPPGAAWTQASIPRRVPSSSRTIPNLVASTTSSRRPAIARPTSRSLVNGP